LDGKESEYADSKTLRRAKLLLGCAADAVFHRVPQSSNVERWRKNQFRNATVRHHRRECKPNGFADRHNQGHRIT
jgi:hypothetical protein